MVKFQSIDYRWISKDNGYEISINETEQVIEDGIERLCYEMLSHYHGGWENNDGGSGEFLIDVAEGSISWTHNEYYTESNTSEMVI